MRRTAYAPSPCIGDGRISNQGVMDHKMSSGPARRAGSAEIACLVPRPVTQKTVPPRLRSARTHTLHLVHHPHVQPRTEEVIHCRLTLVRRGSPGAVSGSLVRSL